MTGYDALRGGTAWIDLSTRGKIRVTGEDAGRLLHAMTTNDVKNLASGKGLYAFFLTDKGRVSADVNIFRIADEFLLDTEPETAARVFQHLDKYIIADDAYVTDETAEWHEIGIEGPQSAVFLEEHALPIPTAEREITTFESGYLARLAVTGPLGFRIWTKDHEKLDLLTASIPQASYDTARLVMLENGIPRYGEDISERYLVQETQAFHAVNFNKGCYLGQEIVERIRSQGKVHRLLTPIRVSGSVPLPPATKLLFNDATAGEVTSSMYSPAVNEVVGLAYIRAEILEKRSMMTVEGDASIQARVN